MTTDIARSDAAPQPLTLLYTPASHPEMLVKALGSGADIVVADLEDAVAPSSKAMGRRSVAQVIGHLEHAAAPTLQVRVNAVRTPWYDDDVAMLAELPSEVGVRLPKCSDTEGVARVVDTVAPRAVHVLIESALGVERAFELASVPGVASVALGEADLRADLGVENDAGLLWHRARIINAAAAAGLQPPMMSVYTNVADLAGLAASCRLGRELGFVGRAAIHPRQLRVIREAFQPTDEQLERAREIVEAARLREGRGDGALALPDGQFVDEAVVRQARRLISRARDRSS